VAPLSPFDAVFQVNWG